MGGDIPMITNRRTKRKSKNMDASLNFRHEGRGNYLPEIDSKSTYKMKQLISGRN
jgi:hypothetical protein